MVIIWHKKNGDVFVIAFVDDQGVSPGGVISAFHDGTEKGSFTQQVHTDAGRKCTLKIWLQIQDIRG